MLGGEPFRHDLLRKYSMVFGSCFADLAVQRRAADGSLDRLVRVPLSYAPKEKVLARVMADPGVDRQSATILPRMSFELTSVRYNGNNKLRSVGRNRVAVDPDRSVLREQLNPVPYDLTFTLWVYVKYIEDGNQIVEQVVPFFTPCFACTVDLIEETGVQLDCQTSLDSVTVEDVYTGDFKVRRATMWTLTFTMTAYLFGPVRRHPVIKFADGRIHSVVGDRRASEATDSDSPAVDRVTVQPGLTPDGEPTTDVNLSVHYSEVAEDDDWDYAVTIAGSLVPGDVGGD